MESRNQTKEKPVRVQFNLPIKFALDSGPDKKEERETARSNDSFLLHQLTIFIRTSVHQSG